MAGLHPNRQCTQTFNIMSISLPTCVQNLGGLLANVQIMPGVRRVSADKRGSVWALNRHDHGYKAMRSI